MGELIAPNENTLPALHRLPEILAGSPFNALNHPNNEQSPIIASRNDYEACHSFLARFESKSTLRAYRKEIERLLLWCVVEKLSFGQINKEAVDSYIHFLKNPTPRRLWCYASDKARSTPRNSPAWKPFVTGLTDKALKQHLNIISSLFKYLSDACYLRKNPFALCVREKYASDTTHFTTLERIPTKQEWQLILQTLKSWPNEKEKVRLKFIIAILFYTGMRLSELASLQWSSFHHTQAGWSIFIIGKGGKPREVVVEDLLIDIIDYRQSLGLSLLPEKNEVTPVVCNLEGDKGISDRQIFNLVKGLALKAASGEGVDALVKTRLSRFSPHWIRHLCPTLMARAGVDTRTIQRHLGHSSSRTTEVYVHLLNDDKRDAVRQLTLGDY